MSVNITLLFLVMVRVWEKNFSFAQTKTNGRLYYIDLNLMANTRNPFRFSDNPLKTWWSVEYSVHKKIKCHGYRQTADIEYNARHCCYLYYFELFMHISYFDGQNLLSIMKTNVKWSRDGYMMLMGSWTSLVVAILHCSL